MDVNPPPRWDEHPSQCNVTPFSFQGLPDHALYSAGGRIVAHSTLHASQQPLGSLLKIAQFAGLMPKIHPHANKVSITVSATIQPNIYRNQ